MTESKKIYFLGAGGHARVLIDILGAVGIVPTAIFDSNPLKVGASHCGIPIIGAQEDALMLAPLQSLFVNTIGNNPLTGNAGLLNRKLTYEAFKSRGFNFLTIVSRDAKVSDDVSLLEGCQIVNRSLIHPNSKIGCDTIVNTGASIDHDCVVGSHTHIAPAAVLCGGVRVGDECHIGARAVVTPGVCIGDSVVVGAGAVVLSDIKPGCTVAGNPAQLIKKNKRHCHL
jgi:sugar O-acyltransferase (sialic acid O-acetyltransferase NeuD family)